MAGHAFLRPPFFFFATAMLSTRFGYGRPAFFARCLASDLSADDSFVERVFRGAGRSHGVLACLRFRVFFAAMSKS